MKNLIWLPLLLLLVNFSCEDNSDKAYSIEEMEELAQEIQALSESVPCADSSDWRFTPMGSKACGGPVQYIAYHQSVEEEFLNLVEQYTQLQSEFNQKNNVVSDCALVAAPQRIICEGGKPFFVY